MKDIFNKLCFCLVLIFATTSKLQASLGEQCLDEHVVEGQLLISSKKKLIVALNKGTHKEIIVRVGQYDTFSYRCAMEGCNARVKLKLRNKEKFPREYTASSVSFIREIRGEALKMFSDCGYK